MQRHTHACSNCRDSFPHSTLFFFAFFFFLSFASVSRRRKEFLFLLSFFFFNYKTRVHKIACSSPWRKGGKREKTKKCFKSLRAACRTKSSTKAKAWVSLFLLRKPQILNKSKKRISLSKNSCLTIDGNSKFLHLRDVFCKILPYSCRMRHVTRVTQYIFQMQHEACFVTHEKSDKTQATRETHVSHQNREALSCSWRGTKWLHFTFETTISLFSETAEKTEKYSLLLALFEEWHP